MALLSWSNQYLIGEQTIDAEHCELFRLINNFHSLWLEQRHRQDIASVLNQLVKYAEVHFQHEESIMNSAEYPGLAEHHKAHEELFDAIFRLQQEYESNDLHLEQDTMKFVRSWLIEHIIKSDYAFRDFLRKPHKTLDPNNNGETNRNIAKEIGS